jgi:RNA polymerase sigma-70 factor (ECF subfamily)
MVPDETGGLEGKEVLAATAEYLRRWQEEDDLDALDALLRGEIERLKRRILHHGPGGLSTSLGASDAANEVVMRMLRQEKTPEFPTPAAMRGYLWRCARNLLIDHLRAKRGATVRLDATDATSFQDVMAVSDGLGVLDDEEVGEALALAMNLLSDDDREVLHLSYMEGLAVKDIAGRVGVAPEAVKMRLVRARRRLASRLASWRDVMEDS